MEVTMAKKEQLPELWGANRVAEYLGVQSPNLYKLAGLPKPRYGPDQPAPHQIDRGQLWLADEIRAFKIRRAS